MGEKMKKSAAELQKRATYMETEHMADLRRIKDQLKQTQTEFTRNRDADTGDVDEDWEFERFGRLPSAATGVGVPMKSQPEEEPELMSPLLGPTAAPRVAAATAQAPQMLQT